MNAMEKLITATKETQMQNCTSPGSAYGLNRIQDPKYYQEEHKTLQLPPEIAYAYKTHSVSNRCLVQKTIYKKNTVSPPLLLK